MSQAQRTGLSEDEIITSFNRTLEVIKGLEGFGKHRLPEEREQLSVLKSAIFFSLIKGREIYIYAGSCPDYSHKNGLYTHEGIGDGLPLLSKLHVDLDVRLVESLLEQGVACRYLLMLADVEVMDDYFCQKFTGGDRGEFLARCSSSVRVTGEYLREATKANPNFFASSFFEIFGQERFMQMQDLYEQMLLEKSVSDLKFYQRVEKDTKQRTNLYAQMYPKVSYQTEEGKEFLMGRTRRTMAQYRALADLILAAGHPAMIINHPTVNISTYNEGSLSLSKKVFHKIPVILMNRRVYI